MKCKINKQGVSFPYAGDVITWVWPWKGLQGQPRYKSSLYRKEFNTFREYWKMCGRAELEFAQSSDQKLLGFSFYEVLGDWSKDAYPSSFVLILKDVDPSRKGPTFWSRLSDTQIRAFNKDIVVMRCKDKMQAAEMLESIPRDFAEAYILKNGLLIDTNLWTD